MPAASSRHKAEAYHLRSPSENGTSVTPSPIHNLPPEIVADILAGLDSSSLSSAILAHRLFWETFQVYQRQILRERITRVIPPQLVPLASVTYQASLIDYSDWNRIRRLLDQLHDNSGHAPASSTPVVSTPAPPPWEWPLTRRVATAMERVYVMAQYFAADFAQQTIPRFNHIFETTRPETCTPPEQLRILRAFYRFQLYCNIFGRKAIESTAEEASDREYDWARHWESQQPIGHKSGEDMRCELKSFFWAWPPWVNEQLACVFEYLEIKLSGFFDEVAAHDVEWGYRRVNWIEPTVAIPHRHFLLYNGLELPYQLCQSQDFETWKMLLESADDLPVWPTVVSIAYSPVLTMADSLSQSSPSRAESGLDSVQVGSLGHADLQQLVGQAAWAGVDDAATLPASLWVYAHHDKLLHAAVLSRSNVLLREAGYVFWDGDVGEAPEILERIERYSWTFNERILPDDLNRLRYTMGVSWEDREEIWLQGGWGYWAPGDESRVRYL